MRPEPKTARFMTVDPDVAETRSPYADVAGNPLNATDPSGMCLGWLWGASDCQLDPLQVIRDPVGAALQVSHQGVGG